MVVWLVAVMALPVIGLFLLIFANNAGLLSYPEFALGVGLLLSVRFVRGELVLLFSIKRSPRMTASLLLTTIGAFVWCVGPYVAWRLGVISDDDVFVAVALGFCATQLAFLALNRRQRIRLSQIEQNPPEETDR